MFISGLVCWRHERRDYFMGHEINENFMGQTQKIQNTDRKIIRV